MVADSALGGRRPFRVALGIAADFHFDEPAAVHLGPVRKLLAQPLVGIAGEAAAAVDHHLVAAAAEQRRQREAQNARLQVPERRIEGGDGAGGEARAAEVANLTLHRQQASGNVETVLPLERFLGDRLNQRSDAGVRVGVAEARLIAGLDVHDDQRRRIPCERAVRLGTVGRNLVGGGADAGDDGLGDFDIDEAGSEDLQRNRRASRMFRRPCGGHDFQRQDRREEDARGRRSVAFERWC